MKENFEWREVWLIYQQLGIQTEKTEHQELAIGLICEQNDNQFPHVQPENEEQDLQPNKQCRDYHNKEQDDEIGEQRIL